MKIKIPPYPNLEITEEAYQNDIISSSIVKNDSSDLTSNKLILAATFKTGEKRIIKSLAVRYKSKLYITAFPNPIHLFLSLSIEHYNNSEGIKENNFTKCGIQKGDNVYLLDFEEKGTHECYNHYVKYRASSIIMLVSSLEAFLNHIIPNNFIYHTIRGNKPKQFNKTEIESTKVSFAEKLIHVIPKYLENAEFWDNITNEKDIILALYENRKNIIHLKTNAEDDLTRYFDAIDKMLDFDILSSINATITFMNSVSNKFVEFEKEEKS